MFCNSSGFNRGCGCGCGNTMGSGCGCGGTSIGLGSMGTGCGCGFVPQTTPITLPESTCYAHSCHYHEHPVIQPIENRTVRHHNFYPRVYTNYRYTTEDVVEPNNVATLYSGGSTMTYPNYTNFMNTL